MQVDSARRKFNSPFNRFQASDSSFFRIRFKNRRTVPPGTPGAERERRGRGKTGSVGKVGAGLRLNRRPSVKRSPRCAGFADRRYRHSPIPAQKAARRASSHQKPGPSVAAAAECPAADTDAPGFSRSPAARLPTLPVSRAVTGPRHKKGARRPEWDDGRLALWF